MTTLEEIRRASANTCHGLKEYQEKSQLILKASLLKSNCSPKAGKVEVGMELKGEKIL